MDLEEYHEAAMRTAVLRGEKLDLEHSILGLTTEIGEFATNVKRAVVYGKPWDDEMKKNSHEELGDILWYLPLGLGTAGYRMRDMRDAESWLRPDYSLVTAVRLMIKGLGYVDNAVPEVSAAVHYQRAAGGYCCVYFGVLIACNCLGFNIGEVLQANIDKLRKRFPEKFTPELAEARLDKGGASAKES